MNKKQLIVAWVMGVLLLSGCITLPSPSDFDVYNRAVRKGHAATLEKEGKFEDIKIRAVAIIRSLGYGERLSPKPPEGFEFFYKQTDEDWKQFIVPAGSRRIILRVTDIGNNKVKIDLVNGSISKELATVDEDIQKIVNLIKENASFYISENPTTIKVDKKNIRERLDEETKPGFFTP